MQKVKYALTHASGMLAEALLVRMAEAGIKADSIILLDKEEVSGNRLPYGGSYLTIGDQHDYDYENLTAVLLLEPDEELASLLQHADCYVISHHSVPHDRIVNLAGLMHKQRLPEPPCHIRLAPAEMATLIPVLNIIHAEAGLTRVTALHVLSAAVYGKAGVEELASQTVQLLNSQDVKVSLFPFSLAFNMFATDTDLDLEFELFEELQIEGLKCSVQKIQVPAFHGMVTAVGLETAENMSLQQLTGKMEKLADYKVSDQSVSPMTHCKKGFDVYISGLKHPQKDLKRLQFWITADSVRNSLVKNYLMVMEILLKSYL